MYISYTSNLKSIFSLFLANEATWNVFDDFQLSDLSIHVLELKASSEFQKVIEMYVFRKLNWHFLLPCYFLPLHKKNKALIVRFPLVKQQTRFNQSGKVYQQHWSNVTPSS